LRKVAKRSLAERGEPWRTARSGRVQRCLLNPGPARIWCEVLEECTGPDALRFGLAVRGLESVSGR
jgi:hypothetical protein